MDEAERNRPALEDLEAFVAIVDQGGVSAAARALGLPKSTVSRRLVRLEGQLGVALLYRSQRRLSLTDAGRDLVERARRLLLDVDGLVARAAGTRAEPKGALRVSAPADLSAQTQVWASFVTRYPAVQLRLEFSNRYADLLRDGIDLALRGGPGDDPDLVARRVGTYCLRAVASPDYVDAQGRLTHHRELWERDCVLLKGLPPREDLGHRVARVRHTVINDLQVVREAARAGMGIAILPADLVADDLSTGALVAVLDEYDPLEVPLYAVYPDRRFLPASVVAFIQHVQAAFASPPA